MKTKTHIAFASFLISFYSASSLALVCSVFSILADIDLHISKIIHRTYSHSFLLIIPFVFVSSQINDILFYCSLAWLSHPIIDLMNYSPTYLFYPMKIPFRMFKRFAIRVGSMGEEVLFWTFTALTILMIAWVVRGDLPKKDLTNGLVFGGDAGFKFGKNIRSDYLRTMSQVEKNMRDLNKQKNKIITARQDSIKYESYPRNPSKVNEATNRINSALMRIIILEEKMDTLKTSPTIKGLWLPLTLDK